MLLDARSLSSGEVLDTDICIVGAGAAGVTVALALIDWPVRVVIIESGGIGPDIASQRLYVGATTGRAYYPLDACRLRYLGGSTNFWGGWCRPLDAIDFEARPWVPYSGWPLSRQDLDPYYARAHAICRLGPYDYEPDRWRVQGETTLPSGDATGGIDTMFQIRPTRFGHEYRAALERAHDVRLVLHANAVEIAVDDAQRTAACIHAATLTGVRFSVAAKAFVLSAGGIETPRLLLASRRRVRGGIGNGRDLVGRFFTEHLHAPVALIARDRTRHRFYLSHASHGTRVRGAVALSPTAQRRDRLLGCAITLHRARDRQDVLSPAIEPDSCTSARVLLRAFRRRERPEDMARHLWRAAKGSDELLALLYRKTVPRASRELIVGCRAEQAPNPENRVTLDDDLDPFDMPKARVHWQLSPQDLASLGRARQMMASVFAAAALRFRRLPPARDGEWPDRIAPAAHHIGTVRMHADAERGVVDAHCRVHGISNLFVAGSAVFPTAGWAPPTLTIVALSIRLADYIAAVLSGRYQRGA
jgi:choline dehydrogenase-like flavoprotein